MLKQTSHKSSKKLSKTTNRSSDNTSVSIFPQEESDVGLFVANALRAFVIPLGSFLKPQRKDEVKVLCCAIILRITASSLIGSELLTEALVKDINKIVLEHPENPLWRGVKSK